MAHAAAVRRSSESARGFTNVELSRALAPIYAATRWNRDFYDRGSAAAAPSTGDVR